MPDPQLREAYTLIEAGKYEKAQTILTALLSADPTNADAHYLASYLAEDVADRMNLLRQALLHNPEHPHARQALDATERDPFSATMLIPDADDFFNQAKPKRDFDESRIIGIAGLMLLSGLIGYAIGRGWLFAPSTRQQAAAAPTVTVEPTIDITQTADANIATLQSYLTEVAAVEPNEIVVLPRVITIEASPIPTRNPSRNELIDDAPYMGSLDAPVVMVEFGDYEDPFTARFHRETLPNLLERYGDQLLYIFRDYPLDGIHSNAQDAAEAANCIYHEQDRFWEFHDALLTNDAGVSFDEISLLVESLDLDYGSFISCFDGKYYAEEVTEDYLAGTSYGVEGTPTFFINGTRLVGAVPIEQFIPIIERELDE